jgi:tyrosine-protein kinase Etk/Wzc
LIGDATFEEAVHATGIHQLDFISAGTTPPNPAELLGSQRMVDLLQKLRGLYDTIVLDAPPLLAVTDASILVSLSDRVAVVLEAGGVQIKAAQRLKELLEEAHAPVAGLILNDKTGKGMEYYASYRGRSGKYKYGYGYYSSGYSDEGSEPVSSGWWQSVKGFFRFRR